MQLSVAGSKNLSVVFEEELWIPVWVPSLCRKASLTIMNRVMRFFDLVVATAHFDFDSIPRSVQATFAG